MTTTLATAPVRTAAAGDASDHAALYRRLFADARRAALSVGACSQDADDAAQDATLATLRRLPALDPESLDAGAYVRVAARRAALRSQRRRSAFLPPEAGGDDHGCTEGAHERVERADLRRTVRGALAALPQRQRTALFRAAYQDRTCAEIGAELGLDANGAAQLLHRARRGLARGLATAGVPR
jgi:RNA polymerase sigma-70 factor (ECF subfamily)